jgi:hypothetical protein
MLRRVRVWRADEWPKVRAKGKANFLFRYGFLGRGLPLGVVAALAIEAALGSRFPDALSSAPFLARLAFCVAVMTLSGCVAATFNWNLHERRHARRA